MKIIIAGGGTGGHIFPIIEFINECAARKIEVLWLGTNRGLERKHKPDGCTLIEMNISGFRGKKLFKKFISIVLLFFSIIRLIPKILLSLSIKKGTLPSTIGLEVVFGLLIGHDSF